MADVLRHHRADAVNGLQVFFACRHQRGQFAVVAGEQLSADVAHFADAERVDEARQRRAFCRLQGGEDVLRRFFRHARQRCPVFKRQGKEVGGAVQAVVAHQLFDEFVAESLDVERLARGEMDERLRPLCAAMQAAGAARHRLAFRADDF